MRLTENRRNFRGCSFDLAKNLACTVGHISFRPEDYCLCWELGAWQIEIYIVSLKTAVAKRWSILEQGW